MLVPVNEVAQRALSLREREEVQEVLWTMRRKCAGHGWLDVMGPGSPARRSDVAAPRLTFFFLFVRPSQRVTALGYGDFAAPRLSG
jgi:hypothetical protein